MGRGVLPPDSDCNIGSSGLLVGQPVIEACQNTDVVLALGCKFGTFTPIHNAPVFPKPAGQTIIQINIDAESIGRSVPVDIDLVGDARATLEALLDMRLDISGSKTDRVWLSSLQKTQQDYCDAVEVTANAKVVGGGSVLNEASVAKTISELIPQDAVTVVDGGQTINVGNHLHLAG